jgi:hypothetical protein
MCVFIEPRVFYRARGVFCLGPLGVYDLGDVVNVEGTDCVIRAIEPDGAGIACSPGTEPLRFPCKGLVEATPPQREQIKNQILANRAAHGLSAVDPRAAA